MKKFTLLFGLTLLLPFAVLHSQDLAPRLTHEMTPEEELRKNEIGLNFIVTDPPVHPVRMVAEFEEMQSVLIRYPFGIPMTLIKDMADDCKVKTIVASTDEQAQVLSQYEGAGVNIANCEWLIAPTDTYWTRDYGPWFIADSSYQVGIVDFPYNRPRPDDDNIPVVLAGQMGIPLYGMDLTTAGGNYMCDGLGIAASTDLILEENSDLSEDEIDTMVWDYLGITKYHILPDPLGEYIKHIDCWGKFLDVDKVLIGQVPVSDYRYADFEYVANYFAMQTSSWGDPYQVYRVYTPGNYPYTPYTNSLILNKKVYVPQTGSEWDDEALASYEAAMPGYEVVGVLSSGWVNTDALHCRAIGIADEGMLYVNHMPLLGNEDFRLHWDLYADIVPYSGSNVVSDSLLCYYKSDSGSYQAVPLSHMNGYHYKATIPFVEPGSQVSYYLHAADNSGRKMYHPYIGPADPHVFTVSFADDAVADPDSLIFLTAQDMIEGKSFNIYNYTNGDLVINDIEQEGFGYFHWYIDPWVLTLPYTMTYAEILTLNVKIDLPVDNVAGTMLTDTMDIITENGHQYVIIRVDSDLLNSVTEPGTLSSLSRIESVSPNPFSAETHVSFSLDETLKANLVVYDLQGRVIKILCNQELASGKHDVAWNGKDDAGHRVSPGIYFVKLSTEKGIDLKKLIVSK